MSFTTDPKDPRLTHGADDKPTPQAPVYVVLSDEERKKGYVRPVRRHYRHVGERPKFPLRELTADEQVRFDGLGYLKFEAYPTGGGRYWTAAQLAPGCDTVTTMAMAFAETYARDPKFYGSTYCCHCQKHRPVAEFVWEGTDEVVGSGGDWVKPI